MLESVVDIAYGAGQKIMEVYNNKHPEIVYKADNTPLTKADIQANQVIEYGLKQLSPNISVISEETLNQTAINQHSQENEVWIVDPLDGTKEFIKRNDEFTVNIALIRNHQPVLGVVYAPALELMYYGSLELGAWKSIKDSDPVQLKTFKQKRNLPVIIVSHSELNQKTKDWLKNFGPHKLIKLGSSLKICYLIDGIADYYPRLEPIMEWDIAAADAVLRAAGGRSDIVKSALPLQYNKHNLYLPEFIASSV